MAINESALEYLHPHVVSTVTSETINTVDAVSDVSFFYAIASEKGLDNKTQIMSSAAQFIKEYGEPNMKKYGQAGHNIVNLLNAGANVYVLRVLPGDATYAHAFLNIQTKVNTGTKSIKDINGNIIFKDDVFLRNCTAYSELTASSKEALENQLGIKRVATTIDGYSDNLLFCIYPIGRGEAYNNLGFRIKLNNSYDDMYDFRVYTFEVIEYDEYDNASTVEGPYYVSLYPDAISYSGDSMFIADVLGTYSEKVRCSFNEETFYNLAELINPNVHPQTIDILSGQSRLVSGQPETYYDDVTLKYEDVHLALRKYDINGDLVLDNGFGALNISDASDESELTTIEIDNSLRQAAYNSANLMLEKMQVVLGEVLQKKYGVQLDRLIRVEAILGEGDDALIYDIVGGKYKVKEDALDMALHAALKAIFTDEKLPSQLLEGESTKHVPEIFERAEGYFPKNGTANLVQKDQALVLCLEDLIDILEEIIPYIKIMEKSTGYATIGATIETYLDTWKNTLNSTESFVYTLTSMQSAIIKLQENLIYIETLSDAKEKLSAVAGVFSTLMVDLLPNLTIGVKNIDSEFNHYVTKVEKGAELFTNVKAAGKDMENAMLVVEKILNPDGTVDEQGQLVYFYLDKDGNILKDADGKFIVQLGDRFILVDDPRLEGLGVEVGDFVVPGQYIAVQEGVEGYLMVVEEESDLADNLISIKDPMIANAGFDVGDFVKLVYNALESTCIYPFMDMYEEIYAEMEKLSSEINNLGLTYLTDEYIKNQLKGYIDEETGEKVKGVMPRMLEVMSQMLNLIDPVSALYAFSKHYSIINKYAVLSAFGAGCRTTIIKGVYKCKNVYLESYHKPESATTGTMSQVLANANQSITEAEAALENLKTFILMNILEGSGTIFRLSKGNDGNISYSNSLIDANERHANINSLLVKAYKGLIDENVTNKRLLQFNYLLDANFDIAVKNAMVDLATNIRKDLFLWLDTEMCANPTQALAWRSNKFPVITNAAAIYAQDGIVFDEYQGKDVRVSMSYVLASMIPTHAKTVGLQFPMAGNARGAVSLGGISYLPNEVQKEEMYNRQINYVETNGRINKFGSQLTATSKNDSLVNINNMLVVLDIKRNVEIMAEDVIFEFNEETVINNFQQALNSFLAGYTNNKSCESISASVYSSDYDKTQKILRVSISVAFYGIIERVIININVVK